MSRLPFLLLISLALAHCRVNHLDDAELLIRCWNATPVPGAVGEYRLHIEAIVIPGLEGGVYARTRTCPDHRLRIDYHRVDIRHQFDRIADASLKQMTLGTGIRADARLKVKQRRGEYLMSVVITQLFSLETMTRSETDSFIREFDIG
jgi:hypothetical protein